MDAIQAEYDLMMQHPFRRLTPDECEQIGYSRKTRRYLPLLPNSQTVKACAHASDGSISAGKYNMLRTAAKGGPVYYYGSWIS
jgi:hypothetical protein